MILGRIGVAVTEDFSVTDSANNLVAGIDSTAFVVHIFDSSGSEVSGSVPLSIIPLGFGHYRLSFTPNSTGVWMVVSYHATYFPWGKSGSVQVFTSDFDSITTLVTRILGLTQENFSVDNTTHDALKNLLTSRVRIYSNAADVGTANNVIATYNMTATYDTEGQMQSYKVVKQ